MGSHRQSSGPRRPPQLLHGVEDQGGRGRDAGIDQADCLPDDQVGVDEPLDVSALSQEQPEGMANGVDRVGDLHGFPPWCDDLSSSMRQEGKKSGLICQGDLVALYGIGTAENIQPDRGGRAEQHCLSLCSASASRTRMKRFICFNLTMTRIDKNELPERNRLIFSLL